MIYSDLMYAPYKKGERGPWAYDCYGLVRELYRRDWGIVISDYPTHETKDENLAEMLRAAKNDWVRVPPRTPRCAVTFNLAGETHIGYMLDAFDFIHTRRETSVTVDSALGLDWKKRVTGFYQWKAVIENLKVQ